MYACIQVRLFLCLAMLDTPFPYEYMFECVYVYISVYLCISLSLPISLSRYASGMRLLVCLYTYIFTHSGYSLYVCIYIYIYI
jgi:hypothetical protein